MGERRFSKGERVWSTAGLVACINEGLWHYLRDTPKHPEVLASMTVRTLRGFVEAGMIYTAEENADDG